MMKTRVARPARDPIQSFFQRRKGLQKTMFRKKLVLAILGLMTNILGIVGKTLFDHYKNHLPGFQPTLAIEEPSNDAIIGDGDLAKTNGMVAMRGWCKNSPQCEYTFVFVRESPNGKWYCVASVEVTGTGEWRTLAKVEHVKAPSQAEIKVRACRCSGSYRLNLEPSVPESEYLEDGQMIVGMKSDNVITVRRTK